MAITAPSQFTCGKTLSYVGDTITCTWTAASGNFSWYHIMVAIPNSFKHFYIDSTSRTSYSITLDESFLNGYTYTVDLQFSIRAGRGSHDLPDEQSDSSAFTLYVSPTPPVTAPDPPSSISVGDVKEGSRPVVSWGASGSADVTGYILERSVNGGAFETIYTGTALWFTDQEAGQSWNTVQYRVQANSGGGASDWLYTEVKTVLHETTPLPPAVTGPRLEQFQNSGGSNIYPRTVVEGVFRQSDGKTLTDILDGMELGVTGPAGPGVPAGGAAGQVLAKKSGADYDTEWIVTEPSVTGVTSFNGRTGTVAPQAGDYTAAQVGAVPVSRKINGKALTSDITLISCGTSDLTAGASALAAGTLYGVYEA